MIKKLLTSKFDSSPDNSHDYMLNLIIVLLFSICLFFLIIDTIIVNQYSPAILNATGAILSLIVFCYFHKTNNIRNTTCATVIIVLAMLFGYLIIAQHENYALYWISVFPVVVFSLLESKRAWLVTFIYGALLLIFILIRFRSWSPAEFNVVSIFNIIAVTFGLIVFISYFERSRKEAIEVLKENNDKLELILNTTAESIIGIDLNGICIFCNASCIEMLDYEKQEELLGKDLHTIINHSNSDGIPISREDCKILKSIIQEEGAHSEDEKFHRADGKSFDVEYHAYPQYKDGKIIGAVLNFMDITQRKMNEQQIKYLSKHDSLTGLYNRSCLEDMLSEMNTEENLPVSIIFADINDLKMTNDIFGHATGDKLIVLSAEILVRECRERDMIARIGGDEFIIFLPNTEASDVCKIISKIKSEISKERIKSIKCSMSLGSDTKYSIYGRIEQTMENAENEMYKEKTMSRGPINSDMISTIIKTLHESSPKEKLHSINVSELCYRLGKAMGLPETEVNKLKRAGFFHDIGKIVLDENIINKDGELTEEEKKEKRNHPVVSYRILNIFDDTLDLAEGAYNHHERWDGSGYPKGLKGKEISKVGRVIAIAEAYDVLISGNGQKKPVNKEEAIKEIKSLSGIRFDPSIVDVFVDMIS